jgi:hypothetical protein
MASKRHPSKSQTAQSHQAEYIASMASELANLARGNRLDLLAQILDLAATLANVLGKQAQQDVPDRIAA